MGSLSPYTCNHPLPQITHFNDISSREHMYEPKYPRCFKKVAICGLKGMCEHCGVAQALAALLRALGPAPHPLHALAAYLRVPPHAIAHYLLRVHEARELRLSSDNLMTGSSLSVCGCRTQPVPFARTHCRQGPASTHLCRS